MTIELKKYSSCENFSSFSRFEEETNFDSVSTVSSSVIPSEVALETVKRYNELNLMRNQQLNDDLIKLQFQITNNLLRVNGKIVISCKILIM